MRDVNTAGDPLTALERRVDVFIAVYIHMFRGMY